MIIQNETELLSITKQYLSEDGAFAQEWNFGFSKYSTNNHNYS